MDEVFHPHWNAPGLAACMKSLAGADHKVIGHSSTSDHMKWPGGWLPDVMVIPPDRLPWTVAPWLNGSGKRRNARTSRSFSAAANLTRSATKVMCPKAIYCTTDVVASIIAKLPKATAPGEATRGLTKRRKSEIK